MDSRNPKRPRHEVSSSSQNPNSFPNASSSSGSHLGSFMSSLLSLPNPLPSILSKFRVKDAPNPKRPRHHEVLSSTTNPNSLPVAPSSNQSHLGSVISTLLSSFPDSSLSSLSPSSIDRVIDKALASASDDVSVQSSLIKHILDVASVLQESSKRCFQKRACAHNSNSWSLPPELTIKVFSKLDTKSLMQAMVCCTMFYKYSMDPSCYSHINLTTSAKTVDNGIVHQMIHRAGKELRSLELGHVERLPKSATPSLTGTCLLPLSYTDGFFGKCLRKVHLHDIRYMKDNIGKSSIAGLEACSNITDLKIVGLYGPSEPLLKSLKRNCRFIEHLFLESYDFPSRIKKESEALAEFVTNIPNLTSLTLIGFRLNDATALNLVEGSRKLKYMNLSRNPVIKGHFLRGSGHNFFDSLLETLILRDCSLEEKEVVQFLSSLSTGNLRSIKHFDVSNNRGLFAEGGKRCYKLNFPLERLKEEGLNVNVVADFPSSLSRSEKLSGDTISSGKNNEHKLDSDSDSGFGSGSSSSSDPGFGSGSSSDSDFDSGSGSGSDPGSGSGSGSDSDSDSGSSSGGSSSGF